MDGGTYTLFCRDVHLEAGVYACIPFGYERADGDSLEKSLEIHTVGMDNVYILTVCN